MAIFKSVILHTALIFNKFCEVYPSQKG